MQILVGLSRINPESEFYSRHLPGFDGRAGCEGAHKDIRRIYEVTHYLGYELVTSVPLLDERATWASVIHAIRLAASELTGPQDILFIYFTCHGQTFGQAPIPIPKAPTGLAGLQNCSNSSYFVNAFLLYDRPIFNFEILEALTDAQNGSRVFTMIDACHAGLGTGLIATVGDAAGRTIAASKGRIKKHVGYIQSLDWNGIDTPSQNRIETPEQLLLNSLLGIKGTIRSEIKILECKQLIQSVLGQLTKLGPLQFVKKEVHRQLSTMPTEIETLYRSGDDGDLKCHITHFGAARDVHQALGSFSGSLFTRMFLELWRNGGGQNMCYHDFMDALRKLIPDVHSPDFEVYPIADNTNPCNTDAPKDHFARQQQILKICIDI